MAVWARTVTAGTLGSAFSIGIGLILGTEQNNIIDPLLVPTCGLLTSVGLASMIALWPLGIAARVYAADEILAAQMIARDEQARRARVRAKYLQSGRNRLRAGYDEWKTSSTHHAA